MKLCLSHSRGDWQQRRDSKHGNWPVSSPNIAYLAETRAYDMWQSAELAIIEYVDVFITIVIKTSTYSIKQ